MRALWCRRRVAMRAMQEASAVEAEMALRARVEKCGAAVQGGLRGAGECARTEGGDGMREREMARIAAQARAMRPDRNSDSNPFLRPATLDDVATYALPASILEALCGKPHARGSAPEAAITTSAAPGQGGGGDDDTPALLARNAASLSSFAGLPPPGAPMPSVPSQGANPLSPPFFPGGQPVYHNPNTYTNNSAKEI